MTNMMQTSHIKLDSHGEGKAVRSSISEKPQMEGISPFAAERIGWHYTEGGKVHGFRNWEKGMPFTRCIGAILRHTFAYMRRDGSEDHLAAIAWNAIALMHYEAVLPGEDDRPNWDKSNE